MRKGIPPPAEPQVVRYELPAEVVAKMRAKVAEGKQKLAEVQAKLQGEVNGFLYALCEIEAERMKLSPGWKQSQDMTALEVIEASKPEAGEAKQ